MSASAARLPLSLGDRVHELLERVEYRTATTDEDREAIFRLRYEAYLREGAIQPNFGRRYSDAHDDDDNAWIVGAYVDGVLASSFRVHVATTDYPDMPANQVFRDLLAPYVAAGKTIIDPTRFVVDPAAARLFPEMSYATVRIGHMAAEHFRADIVLATVRVEHQAFYKRVFGHSLVEAARPYPGLIKPISLMTLDYPRERNRILVRFPFFASTPAERASLFGAPVPAERQPAIVARQRAAAAG